MTHQHTKRKEHQNRDDLTGEHAVGDAGQLILAILFAAVWISDAFFLKYSTVFSKPSLKFTCDFQPNSLSAFEIFSRLT